MKTTIIALGLAILSPAAFADGTPVTLEEKLKYCKSIGNIAKMVMESRQENVPITTLMEAAPKMKDIILDAYTQSVMQHEDNKQRVVNSFRDTYETACVKNLME